MSSLAAPILKFPKENPTECRELHSAEDLPRLGPRALGGARVAASPLGLLPLTEKVDAEIGIVLAALARDRTGEKHLVIFTSDHGDMDGAHRLEHKSVPYEESARVPLIVSWPGHTKAGWVDREHLGSVGLDLIPTLCDFAGIEKPNHLLGRSVRPIAEGKTVSSWRSCLAVEGTAWRMIRTARYKYVVYEEGQRREQLIDLEKDPGK